MADEQIRIDVTAEDDASKVLEQVADEAEQLERLKPKVTVGADVDDATRGIREVRDDAEALSRQDTEILLRARIDDAKASLKALRTDLEQTGDKAADTARQLDRVGGDGGGLKTRGNAIADLTGPLGEASGAASDFAGVFDGISDIAEDVAGKVGLSAAAMTTAIGGIGIAVAGAAAVWSIFTTRQAEARRKQEELVKGQRDLNRAIQEGNTAEAAQKFLDLYGEAAGAADDLGVSIQSVVDHITGQSRALDDLFARYDTSDAKTSFAAQKIDELRDRYQAANGSIEQQDALLRAVETSLAGAAGAADRATAAQRRHERQVDATRGALDRIRGALSMEGALLAFQRAFTDATTAAEGEVTATADEILSLKETILDVAEFAKLTPVQIASLLQRVDQGDLAGVAADVEGYYNANKVPVSTALKDPSSYDVSEWRRRMTEAIGEIPVRGRLTTVRSGNTQIPV